MNGQTVDYGIDLGTTNSAVAKMTRRGPEVLRSRTQSPVTPSAVAVNRQGQTVTGEDALRDPEMQAARHFKRQMGSAEEALLRDGSRWTPERLSAEVLKDLKSTVRRRYDEDLRHVVLTVPAMFQQPQCEATRRAAELAGLEAVVLLQEPIAAATAYLSDQPEPGHYLVYDLGGGTFDVSVVRLHRGEMSVLSHGGDNFLGGSDLDRAVVTWIEGQLDARGVEADFLKLPRTQRLLQNEAERARLVLTDEEEAVLDLSDLQTSVQRLLLPRTLLEDLCEAHVQRTIWLTENRIRETGITASDLKAILLVGGPTQMPMIRRRLKDLGAALRTDLDPMTVVASGAAIHSSTILKPDRARASAPSGRRTASLELHYEPVVQDRKTAASGRITEPADFQGEIRLSRTSGDWQSGWIALQKGAFVSDILLSSDEVTEFQVELRDARGEEVAVHPTGFAVRLGIAAARPVVPYTYGVAFENLEFGPIVRRGAILPAQGLAIVKSSKTIPARSPEELVIHFLEGDSELAEDNTPVGELRIPGAQFARTLPEDSEIQINMSMDESRSLKARVYIPLLDLTYEPQILAEVACVDVRTLRQNLEETREMMENVEAHVEPEEQPSLLQAAREIEHIEAEMEDHPQESATRQRVQKKLADLRTLLRPLARKHELNVMMGEIQELVSDTRVLCQRFDERATLVTVEALAQDALRYYRTDDRKGLERILERAKSLYWPLNLRTPEFWLGYIQYQKSNISEAKDRVRYHDAIRRAEAFLQQGDIEGCRSSCIQAHDMLPTIVASKSKFADATIRAGDGSR